MKHIAILLLIFFLSPVTQAQKKYIPDYDVEFYRINETFVITQVSTKKVLSRITDRELVTNVYHGLIGFKENNKFGMLSIYGKVVIPAIYDKPVEDDYSAFQLLGNTIGLTKAGKLTVLDTLGKTLVPLDNWQSFYEIEYGLIGVYQNDKVGLFKNGKQLLPCIYNAVPSFSTISFGGENANEVTTIQRDGAVGLLHKSGKIVMEPQFDDLLQLKDSFWIGRKDGFCTIFDIQGKLLLETTLSGIETIHGNYILGNKGRYFGIINWKGEEVYPFDLDAISLPIENNGFFARKNNLWGLINLNRPKETAFVYQNNYPPSWNRNQLAILKKNGFYGMINQKGEEVVPFDLTTNDYDLNFYKSIVIVERNNKQGIILDNGMFKIPCLYDSILVQDYFPLKVMNEGKMGLIDEFGELIIPLKYDRVGEGLIGQSRIVGNNGKVGVFQIGNNEIIPPIYDSIYSYAGNYIVIQNGKKGLLNEVGKTIIPCQFSDVVFIREDNIIVQTNNRLEQFNLQTGANETLLPDSICRFETTALVNFGGRMIESQNALSNLTFGDGIWMFMDLKTQAIISEQFYQVGKFDSKNRIVASPMGKDYLYAYNQEGKAIQPHFYVTPKEYFSQILLTESKDSIRYFMKKNGLLNNVSEEKLDEFIQEQYIVKFDKDYIYDDLGEPIDAYFLTVFDRASYFDLSTPFPATPNYVYDFYEEYSRIGKPNAAGWMWAVPKQSKNNEWYEEFSYPDLKTCVLVNQMGERKEKVNYIPKVSNYFLELVSMEEVDTSDVHYLLPFLDSLKKHFTLPFVNSAETQARMLFDSILTRTLVLESFTDYGETSYETQLFFYKRNGLQLFQVAPPKEIVYEFYPVNFNLVKGAEQLNEPDFFTRMECGNQLGYSFGKSHYFLFPVYDEQTDPLSNTTLMEEIKQRIAPKADPVLKESLNHLTANYELIKTGFARVEYDNNEQMEEILQQFPMEDLRLYRYNSDVGFVFENELIVDPEYDLAMLDCDHQGNVNGVVLATRTDKAVRFDPSTRKISSEKGLRFLIQTDREVIMVQPKTKLMNCYPISNENDGLIYHLWVPTIKAKNIKSFFYIGNTSDIPLSNSYGEDSVVYEPNGLIKFVYPPADTFMFDPTMPYNLHKGFILYELSDGSMYYFDGSKDEGLTVSDDVRYRNLPLNDQTWRSFTISKSTKAYILKNYNTSVEIPFKTYKALLKQTPESNFYGGVVIDGVYYSYQTLLPFPEKHDIIIRTGHHSYKVGNKKQLEKVYLGFDNQIYLREKL